MASDIDVLAIHPLLEGPEKVIAVSCKSWQEGFNPGYSLGCIAADKQIGGRVPGSASANYAATNGPTGLLLQLRPRRVRASSPTGRP